METLNSPIVTAQLGQTSKPNGGNCSFQIGLGYMLRSPIKSGGRAKNTDLKPFNPMSKQDRLYPHFMADAWQRDHAPFASKIRGLSVFSLSVILSSRMG